MDDNNTSTAANLDLFKEDKNICLLSNLAQGNNTLILDDEPLLVERSPREDDSQSLENLLLDDSRGSPQQNLEEF